MENVFLLCLTAILKIVLTAWTFGLMVFSLFNLVMEHHSTDTLPLQVPAGIFLPTIAIGACLGRAMGLIMLVSLFYYLIHSFDFLCRQSLYRAYPTAWIFLSCPPDPSVRCISPGFYSVIGAAAMLGGVTRMTSKFDSIYQSISFVEWNFFSFIGCHSF